MSPGGSWARSYIAGRKEAAIPQCCYGDEYNSLFTSKQAGRTASRFRRKGLKGSAQDIVEGIEAVASSDSCVLEVGGGVGQIQVALLEMGVAARTVNVELSSNWEDAAARLLTERNLEDRVQRLTGDFVDRANNLPRADVVVLHRVICCYPHWKAMLDAAIATAGKVIALTFPRNVWWNRIGIGMGNLMCRLSRRSFRGYVHRPEPMIGLIEAAGFSIARDRPRRIWRTLIAARQVDSGS